jgi:ABC-type amino acid transport substrate-binding protein
MRGGESRIQALMDGKADFAIVSGLTAQATLDENSGLRKLIDFGPDTFVSGHKILFSKPGFTEIEDGMIVGIDQVSTDMRLLTEYECGDKKVEFVSFPYHQMLHYLNSGKIDAAIWSTDELTDRNIDVPSSRLSTQKAKELNDINTRAILISGHSHKMLDNLLLDILCPEQIREIQTSVMSGEVAPIY